MDAAARLELALKERLRADPNLAKLATVLGVTHDGLLELMAQLAIDPDATPKKDLVARSSKKPLMPMPEFVGYVKQAIAAARAADPNLFAEVRKAALSMTQPGDPRTGDPALKAELEKMLKRGGVR